MASSSIKYHSLQASSPVVLAFFGPPGVGKGTVARKTCRELDFSTLSTGDLIRAKIAEGSKEGLELEELISRGGLVDDNRMIKMVSEWLDTCSGGVILDGYPRTANQVALLQDTLGSDSKLVIFYFTLDRESLVSRLASRLICSDKSCQEIYSSISKRPLVDNKCDKCSADLYRRKDDAPDVVEQRIIEYKKHENQLLDSCRDQGVTVKRIDVAGKGEDAVFGEFVETLNGCFEDDCDRH
jgi:adenylate kinase